MNKLNLDKDTIPENYVFIVDNITSAFAIATWAAGKTISCIYECKIIDWRKADYNALFDIILSDVKKINRVSVEVPHPYFMHSPNIFMTIWKQKKFIKNVRKIFKLDKSKTYVSCSTSSILISNKTRVDHVLIDEGMGSIIARHRPKSSFLKRTFGGIIIPFRFAFDAPQITLSNDSHPAIELHLDYRNFRSKAYETAISSLIEKTEESDCNVLVLLMGPGNNGSIHIKEGEWEYDKYLQFNIKVIKRFIEITKLSANTVFFLKTHPSLGKSPEIVAQLIKFFAAKNIQSYGLSSLINFEESSSLPAEGMLKYCNFQYLLSADISSSVWNVSHFKEVACYVPLREIIDFVKAENSPHLSVYNFQERLNKETGNWVNFF